MARTNIYLPDRLAREWRESGKMNLSQITQVALTRELARRRTDMWLQRVVVQRGWEVSHEDVLGALRAAAAEAGGDA